MNNDSPPQTWIDVKRGLGYEDDQRWWDKRTAGSREVEGIKGSEKEKQEVVSGERDAWK